MQSKILNPGSYTILDGAMGTMLQRAGMPAGMRPEEMIFQHPDVLMDIHRAYAEAGSELLCANTFGANAKKLEGSGRTVVEVVCEAIHLAKQATDGYSTGVMLDIGPLGELLEPAGTMTFEEAYALFAEIVRAGEHAGADAVLLETFTDLYELKAGVLAAVENTKLPVFASMTFETDGRTFAGVPVESFAATIGGLGVAALGINCSLGPAEIFPMAQRLCAATPLPVLIKPNAGLPDPVTGQFKLTPQQFLQQMQPYAALGVSMVGGCCGTEPETIRLLQQHFGGLIPAQRQFQPRSMVCSDTVAQYVTGVTPIGERINPTGKKRLQEALRSGDLSYLQSQAAQQEADGALILDVNVGTPGVDEVDLLPRAVKAIQAVTGLPLQLDSANPTALEAALRVYNGKAIVNSTSGEQEKLAAILPLCEKYGAAVVGLTLDEDGIPEKAWERVEIAKRILDAALTIGMPKEDVYIDCLTLTVSAQPAAAAQTLAALRIVRRDLGLKTLLGVSNVSFGLPNRPLLNATFLTMAMKAGLDLPILNPGTASMMDAIAAFNVLNGQDEEAKAFLERFGGESGAAAAVPPKAALTLDAAIAKGLKTEAGEITRALLAEGRQGLAIVDEHLVPALDAVGKGFEAGKLFLPQLLAAAGAAQASFEVIRATFGENAKAGDPVVVATVKGDVHDIGKNIAKVLLQNYGFDVIDLGRDVPPERVAEAVQRSGARLCGLSALMTTTLPSMEATLRLVREAAPECKVLVAGAVVTPAYAKGMGADYYARDGLDTVHAAQEVYGK